MSAMYQTFQNTPIFQTAWRGFLGSKWTDEVNVRDFIQNNYTQYDSDESFLAAPTSATHLLWERQTTQAGFYAVRRNQDGGGSRRNLRLPCQSKIS